MLEKSLPAPGGGQYAGRALASPGGGVMHRRSSYLSRERGNMLEKRLPAPGGGGNMPEERLPAREGE